MGECGVSPKQGSTKSPGPCARALFNFSRVLLPLCIACSTQWALLVRPLKQMSNPFTPLHPNPFVMIHRRHLANSLTDMAFHLH